MQKYKDLASQLPVWQFIGNFLAFSDHSFGAAFKIQGVDISCMDAQEINLVVDRLEKLLISLENGTRLQVLYKLTPHVHEKIANHLQTSENAPDDIKSVAEFRSHFLQNLALPSKDSLGPTTITPRVDQRLGGSLAATAGNVSPEIPLKKPFMAFSEGIVA